MVLLLILDNLVSVMLHYSHYGNVVVKLTCKSTYLGVGEMYKNAIHVYVCAVNFMCRYKIKYSELNCMLQVLA